MSFVFLRVPVASATIDRGMPAIDRGCRDVFCDRGAAIDRGSAAFDRSAFTEAVCHCYMVRRLCKPWGPFGLDPVHVYYNNPS